MSINKKTRIAIEMRKPSHIHFNFRYTHMHGLVQGMWSHDRTNSSSSSSVGSTSSGPTGCTLGWVSGTVGIWLWVMAAERTHYIILSQCWSSLLLSLAEQKWLEGSTAESWHSGPSAVHLHTTARMARLARGSSSAYYQMRAKERWWWWAATDLG